MFLAVHPAPLPLAAATAGPHLPAGACAGLLGVAPALACVPITLHFQVRPPCQSLGSGGRVCGLVADPAARAFARAGIGFVRAATPSQRQPAIIQAGQARRVLCSRAVPVALIQRLARAVSER